MPDDESVPDIYVDQFTLAQSPYGIALSFSLSHPSPGPAQRPVGEPKAVIRMSLEHAKVMALILRKQLKQYELETIGELIRIPRNVLQQMQLSEDDW